MNMRKLPFDATSLYTTSADCAFLDVVHVCVVLTDAFEYKVFDSALPVLSTLYHKS